jgi:hypothetical protein
MMYEGNQSIGERRREEGGGSSDNFFNLLKGEEGANEQ